MHGLLELGRTRQLVITRTKTTTTTRRLRLGRRQLQHLIKQGQECASHDTVVVACITIPCCDLLNWCFLCFLKSELQCVDAVQGRRETSTQLHACALIFSGSVPFVDAPFTLSIEYRRLLQCCCFQIFSLTLTLAS